MYHCSVWSPPRERPHLPNLAHSAFLFVNRPILQPAQFFYLDKYYCHFCKTVPSDPNTYQVPPADSRGVLEDATQVKALSGPAVSKPKKDSTSITETACLFIERYST